MISSLLYLIASTPNIMFCVGVCARLKDNPNESHLITVKRILRYHNGTRDHLGLWYPKDDRMSTIGNCQFLGFDIFSLLHLLEEKGEKKLTK
jgi:hypothetical protein